MLHIRPSTPADNDAIWSIFHSVVITGSTYAFSPDITREEALQIWVTYPNATYVAEKDGHVVGSYFIKTNQPGLGSHVCNAGYMVDPTARRMGIGKALCEHSLVIAKELGYRAMQFNFVVATNHAAIKLWQAMGFAIIGTIPEAFRHTEHGYTDAHIMHRLL